MEGEDRERDESMIDTVHREIEQTNIHLHDIKRLLKDVRDAVAELKDSTLGFFRVVELILMGALAVITIEFLLRLVGC
jgi:hypothetical protein